MSRRTAIGIGTIAVTAVAIPQSLLAAIPAIEPVPLPLPPLLPTGIREGLSAQFQHREAWLWRKWRNYERQVEPCREVPDAGVVNFQRWYLQMWLTSVAHMEPKAVNDREVLRFAFRLAFELLADFPEVPWSEVEAAKMANIRSMGRAAGLWPERPKSISI